MHTQNSNRAINSAKQIEVVAEGSLATLQCLPCKTALIKFPFKRNGLPCCEDANTFR